MTTPLSEIEARLAEIEEACNAVCSKCNGSKTETRKAYSAGWYDVECLCRLCKGTGKQEIDERIPYLLQQVRALTERCDGYKGQVQAGAAEIERLRAQVARMREALEFIAVGETQDFDHEMQEPVPVAMSEEELSTYARAVLAKLAAVTQDSGEGSDA